MSDEIADALDDAADYIETHGWIRGELCDELGRVCAVGAINCTATRNYYGIATGVTPARRSQLMNLRGNVLIAFKNVIDTEFIPAWNDAEGRTEQEVLDAFRKAAKVERGAPGAD